jgi:acyl dehydratase
MAFTSVDELRGAAGTEIGVSDWHAVDQDRINRFADATGDHQWIHVDPERAKAGPNGGTIAHGFLTLSMIPALAKGIGTVDGVKMGVNYGLNKVRFPAPVPAGSRIRARLKLLTVDDVAGGVQVTSQVTVESDHGDKPVCVAETVSRIYF